jgi:DNA-directed RNA polymerase specialized sigma24 family protein
MRVSHAIISLTSDAELVAQFGASRSQPVFAQIVARHGGMVPRTCLRLAGNLQDAEDAAQATFLILAEKASGIHENLAGWLHKVARDSALNIFATAGGKDIAVA